MKRSVVDDRESPTVELGEAVAHGLDLLGGVPLPVLELADDLDGCLSLDPPT